MPFSLPLNWNSYFRQFERALPGVEPHVTGRRVHIENATEEKVVSRAGWYPNGVLHISPEVATVRRFPSLPWINHRPRSATLKAVASSDPIQIFVPQLSVVKSGRF